MQGGCQHSRPCKSIVFYSSNCHFQRGKGKRIQFSIFPSPHAYYLFTFWLAFLKYVSFAAVVLFCLQLEPYVQMKISVTQIDTPVCFSTLTPYPHSCLHSGYRRQSAFPVKEQPPSLRSYAHLLLSSEGPPSSLMPFLPQFLPSYWNIPISVRASSSISCFGKNIPLTPHPPPTSASFLCLSAQQNFLKKLFLLAVTTSLPFIDSILASFQEAITPLKKL